MQADEWLDTHEFVDVWKTAFRDAKSTFHGLSDTVRASSRRERTGGLWTQIHYPLPGIHLLAIEFQPDVFPLCIRLKVWVDQRLPSLYDSLRNAKTPNLLGQNTVLSPDQVPRSTWKSQLSSKAISLRGLSYMLPDLSFLRDKTAAGEFFEWLIDTIASADSLSAASKTTNETSESDLNSSLPGLESAVNVGESVANELIRSIHGKAPENDSGIDSLNDLRTWEKALAAVTQLGGIASRNQVVDWILAREQAYNIKNSTDLYMMAVNSPARTGYSQNRHPRRTDQGNRYDRLFKVGEGIFEIYNPTQHGIWEIFSDPSSGSQFGVSIRRVSSPVEEALAVAEAAAEQAVAFDPTDIADARQRISADIIRRRGQPAFRKALMDAYGEACAITGCNLPAVLEAAHIHPYKGDHTNVVSNGLLLRADIHTLFDLRLIAIESGTMVVRVSPELEGTEYELLDGSQLRHPKQYSHRVSREALDWHRNQCGWCN